MINNEIYVNDWKKGTLTFWFPFIVFRNILPQINCWLQLLEAIIFLLNKKKHLYNLIDYSVFTKQFQKDYFPTNGIIS